LQKITVSDGGQVLTLARGGKAEFRDRGLIGQAMKGVQVCRQQEDT
jgi:hypothetical protein